MLNAVVTGASGKMGGRIISLIQAAENMAVTGAIEQAGHVSIGKDVGLCLGLGDIGVEIVSDLRSIKQADVVIDFTSHSASLRHLEIAAENGWSIVIGSTGFDTDELIKVSELARNTPCVLSPNMSVGVNVMFHVLELVPTILGDEYDVEIVEAHHHFKKDAPSGTALKMADIVASSLGRNLHDVGVFSRKGQIGERTKSEIGIQTVRAGDIIGDHMVMFCGAGERLEFIHRAHSRDNFAKGAIRAAQWLVGKSNGLYDMQDVLGLREVSP